MKKPVKKQPKNAWSKATKKFLAKIRTKPAAVKRIERNIKGDKYLSWDPGHEGSGKLYLSETFARTIFANGAPIIQSVVLVVEDIGDGWVSLSLQTRNKDKNWLTRMYLGKVMRGNSITIEDYPRLMVLALTDITRNTGTLKP